ncbi:undecaprenyl-phosphomannose:protein mannosyltransferase [Candidatus Rickettsiella viridis]|uniref:Undecaprenyl-phosphomannose:protein mannosyltransferase n=1 Tax=Candidatus Rickettsiella viridis TaxID=676208 RepID=A0A2Z5UVG2_9COXI|nr:glycosyltransferase family 39 protein [Candidatus Rickettsiella viridis]BBB15616.1 undecaprenyl-phosphomannose:protein mannosyltransferase [Candidatus Rickettsiella viridis]
MFLQLFLWSFLPVFIRHAVGNDLIEALTWGHQFQWGYDKNPFLPGILAHLGGIFGFNGFGIYFIQQLFILLGVWSVRALTFELTNNSAYAFIAAVALLLCSAYNIDVQIYNDNYILQGLLPLCALFSYRGVKNNDLKYWLFSAAILGLATLAKYSAILLLPLYALYLLLCSERKKHYFSAKPYLTLLLYALILLPNLIWLYQQDFNAISYAFLARGLLNQLSYLQYLNNNLDFLLNFLIIILPSLFALLVVIEYKKNANNIYPPSSITFDAYLYSFLMGLGPIILIFILASLLSFSLHREWGSTFISFLGSAFFVFFKPRISQRSINRFTIFIVTVMLSFGLGYLIVSLKNDTGAYPGPEIAKAATQVWHEHYAKKLPYVAGDRYTAGYIGYYSADKPQVWMEWNSSTSPWIDKKKLRCEGALFIIESGHTVQHFFKGTQFPTFVRNQFPNLVQLPERSFAWYRNHTQQNPIKVHFALLPLDKNYCQ